MSALTTRDALAKALCELNDCVEAAGWAACDHGHAYRTADYLLASGAVVDAATLADDDAFRWGLAQRMAHAIGDSADSLTLSTYDAEAVRTFRALAAALSERSSR